MLKLPERKNMLIITGLWILLILGVLMMPAPREWGLFGKWLSPRYDQIKTILQPLAHFVLMGVMAIMLMRCFAGRRIQHAVLFSIGIALGLALVFELMQFFLPPSFGRACDLSDVAFSVVGAAMGCSISIRASGYVRK